MPPGNQHARTCKEQLPPTKARGLSMLPKEPVVMEEAPSLKSLKNRSLLLQQHRRFEAM